MTYNENWGPHDATPNWYIPNLILDIERIFAQIRAGDQQLERMLVATTTQIRAGDQQLREPYRPHYL